MSSSTETSQQDAADLVLETRNLTKRFQGLTAVDNLDIQISQGEIRCLIGPNGAGKSTFLKMIVGQHQPTGGSIYFKGEDITDLEPYQRIRRGMSMKFQVPAVYTDLTVRQNMHIAVQRQSTSSSLENRIDEALTQFNLRSEESQRVDDLAHGQQQWLEMAMATALEPELLLLDEPTAGMSIEETRETADLIREIGDSRQITFIIIEHDIDFVRDIAGENLVTVLNQGQLFAEGTIDEIADDEDVQRIYLGESHQ